MRIYPVVVGDLEKLHLGLGEQEFNELSQTIDAIYHCGAYVHSLYPYSKLRSANVLGTIELLKLATAKTAEPLPFFYVSTLSVFPGDGGVVKDDPSTYVLPLSSLEQLGEGYAQTKLIAERLVVEAGKRGVPVKIFRPGRIIGHSTIMGATSVEDVFCRIIKGCLQMGAAPISVDWPVDMNPADFVASVIVRASFVGFGSDGTHDAPHAYHMYHPSPLPLNQLFQWLISNQKYKISMVSYAEWRSKLETACSKTNDNALFPLLPIFPRDPTSVPTSLVSGYCSLLFVHVIRLILLKYISSFICSHSLRSLPLPSFFSQILHFLFLYFFSLVLCMYAYCRTTLHSIVAKHSDSWHTWQKNCTTKRRQRPQPLHLLHGL
jgi:thioester reductase-like protein